MVKKVSEKVLSVILIICIAVSMVSVSVINASANIIVETVTEKLIETGMRVLAESCEELGKATGNENAEKAFSIIANWVFSNGAEATAKKAQELCEEILEKLDEIEEEMNDCFAVVETMLGQDAANTAKTNLDSKWDQDVDGVIKSYDAERSLELYLNYMLSAVNYSKQGLTGQELADAVQPDLDALIMSFANMYNGSIPIEDNNATGVKKYIFEDTVINSKFENMISSLANNLVKSNSTSVAEYAAQFAYKTYPFSHQQHEYVYTVMEKQLTRLQNVEMLYNEYLFQQGEYIKKKYGENSAKYSGYLNAQRQFNNLMNGENIGVNSKIEAMLEYEMTVDEASDTKLTLNDYMKKEDAVRTLLQVDGFENSVTYKPTNATSSVKYGTSFTKEKMYFNKVMANGEIYYIIDPDQFYYEHAMTFNALDVKYNVSAGGDFHYVSPDYLNLIRSMSDGVNTFGCTSDMKKYSGLFNTNAFRLMGSVPADYLTEYFPEKGSLETYIITPKYKNYNSDNGFFTTYEDIYCANANAEASGGELKVIDVSGELAQSDKGGYERKYSVILANQGDSYKQTAHLRSSGDGISDVKIVGKDSNITINNGEDAVVTSGEMISIKFKLSDNAVLDSMICSRFSSSFSGTNGTCTDTVLLDSDDFSSMTVDADGYYSFEYPMPYTNANFILKASIRPNTDDDSVYNISNAQELVDFANTVNSGDTSVTGNVTADIDLTGYEDKLSPIGTSNVPFSGTFKGNNHTISQIKLTNTVHNDLGIYGLFGCVSGGTVKDITLKGEITASDGSQGSCGGVIGSAYNSEFSNITSYLNVNLSYRNVGGIVGYAENSVVENCCTFGAVSGGNKELDGYVGGIAGFSEKSTIRNCSNSGSVSSAENYVGGVLGYDYNYSSTVESCSNTGNVSGDYYVGGVAGCGSVKNCCNTGNVSGHFYTGGAIGSGSARNCYNTGDVTGNSAGSIVGYHYYGSVIDNCYFLNTCKTGDKYSTAKTSEQFASGEVAYLLNNSVYDGTQVWYQNIDNGKTPDDYPNFDGGTVYCGYRCNETEKVYSNYPLSSTVTDHKFNSNGFCVYCDAYQPAVLNNGVYEISNAGQLYWFASLVNGDSTHADFESQNGAANAILVKDIVVNDGDISKLASAQSNSLRKWSPIGTSDNSYTGQFDGQGHTISGIYFSDSTADNVGLFGYTRGGADIYNVGIVNSYIEGKNCVGGILGRNNNSGVNVQHCFSEATVIGNEGVGGIEGSTYGGKIIDCYNAGSVKGAKFVGSIRGLNTNTNGSGAIDNCFNAGEVIGTGNSNIGGIRGDGKGTISNCYCISTKLTDTAATTKSPEQFASGEVAYLLNNSMTDGKQVWYQNIDNGKTPDDYPKFDGGTVYYLEYKDTYSNTYSEPPKPDAFDKDDDENLIIKSYDDLVKLSKLIRSDYEVYGSQNYILQNNIKASDDSEWLQGIGSVSENKPFNGTFDGNGYCIIGLNVNSSEYGGLFEIIGESGCVKDLLVFDCDFKAVSNISGGIVAVNNGTVDHCVSGVNLTSGIIHINCEISIDCAALNSDVKGDTSGGIAGKNNGLIKGCRNAAVVSGAQCGGIAGENSGKIYGSANNVKIGTSSSTISGGIAGKNGGTIESSYNSGSVNGGSEKSIGSIAGINGYGETDSPTVKNVFFIAANNLKPVGTESLKIPDETNKSKAKNSDFQNDAFTDELNAVSDNTVDWVRNSNLNKGYPTVRCSYFEYKVKSAGSNITVEGNMHGALNVNYKLCTEDNSQYKELVSALDGKKVFGKYSASLTDNDGNWIPVELWCQGDIKISVPTDGKNVQFAGIDFDGQVSYYKPDSTKDGVAVFTVPYPMSFALVESDAQNNIPSGGNTNSDNKTVDNTTDNAENAATNSNSSSPIKTGSADFCAVLLTALLSLVLIIVAKRGNKVEKIK